MPKGRVWLRPSRKVIFIGLSILLLGGAFLVAGVDGVLVRLRSYSFQTLALATALLVVNQILASLRFHLVARLLGVRQTPWRSHVVNTLSLVGGLMLFNVLGQSLARSGMFKVDRQGGAAQGFVSTILERALSLVLMVALLVGLVVQYTDGISTHRGHVNAYLTLAVMVVVVVVVVLRWGLGRHRWVYLTRVLSGRVLRSILLSTLVTMLMLATMLAAYVVLARELLPEVPWTLLPLPATVSMLGASVPIGVSGWGVREVTASQAFSYIGFDPAAGVGMALAIGVLSMIALAINALIVMVFGRTVRSPRPMERRTSAGGGKQYLRLLTWALPILCVALLVFRLPVPTKTGFANVNLADPFILVSAVLFLIGAWGNTGRIWRIRGVWLAIIAMAAAVCLSFVLGWVRFGLVDWALFNRFLGVWVLIAMMLAGAFVTNVLGRAGTVMVARSYVLAVFIVLVFEFLLRAVEGGDPYSLLPWNGEAFSGFSGGATAYAYQIALALILVLSGLPLFSGYKAKVLVHGIAAVFTLGLWRTETPSALISVVIILVIFAATRRYSPGRFLFSLACVWLLGVGVTTCADVLGANQGTLFSSDLISQGVARWVQGIWASERVETVRGAIALWRSHPWFGAGLGAFVDGRLSGGLPVTVIRGSYVWALSEVGIVGLLLFHAPIILGAWSLVRRHPRFHGAAADSLEARVASTGLGVIFVTVIMSLFHDLAFQRVFWLLLGAFVATPGALAGTFRRLHPGARSSDGPGPDRRAEAGESLV